MTRIISSHQPLQPDEAIDQSQAPAPASVRQQWHQQTYDTQPESTNPVDHEESAAPLPYPAHVLSSLTLTVTNHKSKPHTHIIPPAHGHAFRLGPNQRFRIVDLHGQQVVDLMAWTHPYHASPSKCQHSSMSYTRYRLGGAAPPQLGECIYTNLDAPMLKLVADTVKTHDMLYMACNPSFYARQHAPGHRNCAENIAGAVAAAGLGDLRWAGVVDPFNVFQNTPYYSLKALGCSRAGDYVEFENVMEGRSVVVGLSCCPFEGEGFNGGRVTEVAVVTERGEGGGMEKRRETEEEGE